MSVKALLEMLQGKPLLDRKALARRYSRDLWTIDRWHRQGVLPKARYLRGCPMPFWRPIDIERAEQTQATLIRALKR